MDLFIIRMIELDKDKETKINLIDYIKKLLN